MNTKYGLHYKCIIHKSYYYTVIRNTSSIGHYKADDTCSYSHVVLVGCAICVKPYEKCTVVVNVMVTEKQSVTENKIK